MFSFFKLVHSVKKGIHNISNRIVTLIAMVLFSICSVFAQNPFAGVTTTISGYKDDVRNLIYAIAAIVALIGAFNIYHKMVNGDQDVKKTIMLTIGGCIALVALATALPAFFNY